LKARTQKSRLYVLALLTLIQLLPAVNLANSDQSKPVVVCTTTILSSFAEEIGGEYVTVEAIVPPGVCPAHYDVTPSAVYLVGNASLILYSGFEPWLESLIEASGNTNVTRVQVGGPWHPYTSALTYVRKVRDALISIMPEHSEYFEARAAQVEAEINSTASEILANASLLKVDEVKVICMQWQKAFVEWMGFNVIATYGPPERLSAKEIMELTTEAEKDGVVLIIDNLPSGYTFGAKLASDVGAQHVVLTNFPGAIPNTETYAKMIRYNAMQLFEAVRRHRLIQGEIKALNEKVANLNLQLKVMYVATAIFAVTSVVEAILLLKRKQ